MAANSVIVTVAMLLTGGLQSPSGGVARPNVVVILADDLGYSDLGCYGGEIKTPHLDALAASGLRFTRFHNTARCWPTRAALLTGYYAQQVRRDKVDGIPSGGNGKRPGWAVLLPEILRPYGYRSYHAGKWHVDGRPLAGGFDHSYFLEDLGRNFHPRVHSEDDHKLPAVEPGTGYYSTTEIASRGIKYLAEHAQKFRSQPFFLYLAFNVPHFPLQAAPEDIARYQGKYRDGWEVARSARWSRIQSTGLVNGRLSDVEPQIGPPHDSPDSLKLLGGGEINRPLPWNTLTDQQREFQATKMTIHAAMVDRMDREIGRVLDQLRAMGAYEDTLIFFLSDNGASAEIIVRDEGNDPAAAPGSARSHLCLGPGWSTVSNTPFRRHKIWVHEGGIATPLIVHWPRGFSDRGTLRHNVGHVIDIIPTILEATRISRPEKPNAPPLPGKSLLPAFAKDRSVEHEELWWEHEGHRAIRAGDWKLVASGQNAPWELYNVTTDPTETQDLAPRYPARVTTLARRWLQLRDEFTALARKDLAVTPPLSNKRARHAPATRVHD